MPFPPTYAIPAGPSPASIAADRSALSNVILAAVIGLVGTLVSSAELFSRFAYSFINVTNTGSGASFTADLTGLYVLAALGGVGLVFALIELWLYREAFHTLAPADAGFATPASLVLAAFIALLLLIAIAAGLVVLLYEAILCAGSGNSITSACINVGAVVGLLAALVIVAIVALIGYIGLLIGIWRLGTRYNDSLFKVGAILLIFPILNIVGTILIIVGARAAREKLTSYPPGPGFS